MSVLSTIPVEVQLTCEVCTHPAIYFPERNLIEQVVDSHIQHSSTYQAQVVDGGQVVHLITWECLRCCYENDLGVAAVE